MYRREWLKLGAAGVATTSLGLWPNVSIAQTICNACDAGVQGTAAKTFELEIGDLATRMVDGEMVNMLAYRLTSGSWRVPGPVIRVKEDSLVGIKITNTRKETHGFEIAGIPASKTVIDPGCTCTVQFVAPMGGTYIYHDSYGDTPLYRILGLHGVLVVEPLNGSTEQTSSNPIASITPYSLDQLQPSQRQSISALFDAMGMTDRFLGGADGKWKPCAEDQDYSNQEKIWIISEVDPRFNSLVELGKPIASNPSLTSNIVQNFVPRYFTLSNRSGFDLHGKDNDSFTANYIGEPTLIRMANVGLAHHSMHTHGNHWMRLSQANLDVNSPDFGTVEVADNIFELDTWSMWPMDRRDLLLPFEIPPDIPYRSLDGKQAGTTQFERMVQGKTQEPFPLRYVVHDHTEMGTTAAGGNYPQGMVLHWEILGGLGGRNAQQAYLNQ